MAVKNIAIEKMAEVNIKRWLLAKDLPNQQFLKNTDVSMGPYITISREVGAGGSEIARSVGSQLGWVVLDHEIIDLMAEKYGTSHRVLEFLDERYTNWLDDWLATWFTGKEHSSTAYNHRLKRIILLSAQHGQVVIVGRGAQFILPQDRGISVRILAPRDFRIEQIVLKHGINAREASAFIDKHDRQHEKFTMQFLHQDSADPHKYDLIINVENLTVDDSVNMIVDAAKYWIAKNKIEAPKILSSNSFT